MAEEDGLTFDAIYRENRWNGIESRSGPGSGPVATRHLTRELNFVVDRFGIESVLDVGCGDGYWMPDLPGYVGLDASTEALRLAVERHPDRDYTRRWPDRRFDLVIVRDVLQHLPLADGLALLDRVRELVPKYLLASTYTAGVNVDIAAGDAFSPDLQAPPFSLGEPVYWIFDGYAYHETDEPRDPTKHLALWAVAGL